MFRSSVSRIPILAGFFLLGLLPLGAHPHVWIDQGIVIEVEKEKVKGFWAEWSFDEIMSASVIADFDKNQDGRFSEAENRDLKRDYFDNLINYDYYSYAWSGDTPLPITVSSFEASVADHRLVYRFFVPLNVTLAHQGGRIAVSMYDESFYVDMNFRTREPLVVTGATQWTVRSQISKNPSRAYYGGMVVPQEAVFVFSKK